MELGELMVFTAPPGAVEMRVWITAGMEWDETLKREMPLMQYATCYVSLKAAAEAYGLPATTVAHWARRGGGCGWWR